MYMDKNLFARTPTNGKPAVALVVIDCLANAAGVRGHAA